MHISISYYNLTIITITFILLQVILNKKKNINYNLTTTIKLYIFIIYILLLLEVTDISKLNDIIYVTKDLKQSPFQGEINLIILNRYRYDYLLNILLFIPLGVLTPYIWKEYRKFYKTIILGLLLSISIEIIQLFNYRSTDINDIITNTIGTLIGYLLFKIISIIRNNKLSKDKIISPTIYIIIVIIIMFLFKNN